MATWCCLKMICLIIIIKTFSTGYMLRDMRNMVKAYKEAYDAAPRTRTGQTLERNLKYYENLMKQQ